ncbi:MAG: hypothetical protein HYV16_01425 [Gammaproteobacteria bacterium]|nr:hypothetical protein [Gammaproteobacteria bacterium]
MNSKKSLSALIGMSLVASLASTAASANPFGYTDLAQGYSLAATGDEAKKPEGKCGEGKCGADKKAKAEGKCGEGKCGADKKAKMAEGKCGEGKCGADKKKAEDKPQ